MVNSFVESVEGGGMGRSVVVLKGRNCKGGIAMLLQAGREGAVTSNTEKRAKVVITEYKCVMNKKILDLYTAAL